MFGTDPDQVEQILVTECSTDGTVRVTIDSSGAPIDLALTDKIDGMPPSEVATLVMACMRRAQQQLARQAQQAMAATVSADEPLVEHLIPGGETGISDQYEVLTEKPRER